ncbi:hypothetical protein [Streptomyces sp. XD-27]|uniref:hypothetical protein n=1 Tax=Streptomyces sp. XD-27 TaxID=3062779 RepID=UPI0026F47976|nr:hypothetical protein [Streptomyces sp. XD-27]WKX71610.1 hypothetical protein Q3Y56_18305 [Streptomyces sp. XD-27]
MKRLSRLVLLATGTGVAAGGAMFAAVSPASASPGIGACYSDNRKQLYDQGAILDSPTRMGPKGTHACINGDWVFAPRDCHVTFTYGGDAPAAGQTSISHGSFGFYGDEYSRFGRCYDGKMLGR